MQECKAAAAPVSITACCAHASSRDIIAKQEWKGTCLHHGGGGTGHGAGITAADCAASGAPPATCSGHQTHTRSVPNTPPQYTRLQRMEREQARQEAGPLCKKCAAVSQGRSPGLAAWVKAQCSASQSASHTSGRSISQRRAPLKPCRRCRLSVRAAMPPAARLPPPSAFRSLPTNYSSPASFPSSPPPARHAGFLQWLPGLPAGAAAPTRAASPPSAAPAGPPCRPWLCAGTQLHEPRLSW